MRTLLLLALAAALLSLAVPLVAIKTYREPALPPKARAIIVITGDLAATRARAARGVALWKAGAAPILVLSGVQPDRDGVNHAADMAAWAEAQGIPGSAIVLEPDSQSTLQNALFTRDALGGDMAAPVILVTHRWHLPRAWASFRWAGFRAVTPVAADPVEPWIPPADIAKEMVKWPVNILRGAAASLLIALGLPEEDVTWFLR